MSSIYPSKLILLGEYTVLNGGGVLALPLDAFSASWSPVDAKERSKESKSSILSFIQNMKANEKIDFLNLKAAEDFVQEGYFLDSNIPLGYGLGSSGSVVAALYDRFCTHPKKDLLLKNELALMESYFHGNSSGIDPYVSYTKKAVQVKSTGHFDSVQLPNLKGLSIFLWDSRKQRRTTTLVEYYKNRCKDNTYLENYIHPLNRHNQKAIDLFLTNGDVEALFKELRNISVIQWEAMEEMIPEEVRPFWYKGLESGDFSMKLCGAGGGGFNLVFSDDVQKVYKHLEKDRLIPIRF